MDFSAFWNNVADFSWRQESPYVVLMVLVLAAVLFHYRPGIRKTLYNTVGFYVISLVGLFIGGIIYALGFSTAAATVHEAFIIAAGVAIIRLWGLLIFRIVLPGVRLVPPRILEDILVMIAYVAWGMVRLRIAGMDLSGIVTTSAVITAVIAFAMQDTLGHLLGGVVLEFEDTIEIGDWIKVDDLVGQVVDIRWRSTIIETRNWETVVIPNGQLIKAKFTVLGKRRGELPQLRRWIWFNVDYSAPPAKVISVAETAIKDTTIPNMAKLPEPNCVLMEFDGGYGRYALRYWLTDLMLDDPTDTLVRNHIYNAFQREGIRFAVAEHSVHMTKEGEKHEEAVKAREMARRLKALKHVDLFTKFSEEELRTVAERLKYAPFSRGDTITRQGDTAHWLYILASGEADVFLEAPGAGKRPLDVLQEGCFFGEMGLMTGASRTATIIARTDVECYRLDKASFEDILKSRPSIAEEIAPVLVRRRAALDSALKDIDQAQRERVLSQQHTEILAKIRRFFGLG